jgi:hypothetical protein
MFGSLNIKDIDFEIEVKHNRMYGQYLDIGSCISIGTGLSVSDMKSWICKDIQNQIVVNYLLMFPTKEEISRRSQTVQVQNSFDIISYYPIDFFEGKLDPTEKVVE